MSAHVGPGVSVGVTQTPVGSRQRGGGEGGDAGIAERWAITTKLQGRLRRDATCSARSSGAAEDSTSGCNALVGAQQGKTNRHKRAPTFELVATRVHVEDWPPRLVANPRRIEVTELLIARGSLVAIVGGFFFPHFFFFFFRSFLHSGLAPSS